MPTLTELSDNPGFAQLSPEAQKLVVDRLAGQDTEFNALSPAAQSLVKQRILFPPQQPVTDTELTVQPEPIGQPEQPISPQTTTVDVPLGQGVRELREQPTSASNRAELRAAVESLPAIPQFIVESFPAVAGTSLGFLAGIPIGQPVAVAMGGGALFEAGAQAIGISPESKANIALSGLGPGIGPGAVKAGQFITRSTISRFPGVRDASRILQLEEAALKSRELGATILQQAKGAIGKPARKLYEEAKTLGVRLTPEQFPKTIASLRTLRAEVHAVRSRPEGRQILRDLKVIADDLGLDPQNVDLIRFRPRTFKTPGKPSIVKEPAGFIKPPPSTQAPKDVKPTSLFMAFVLRFPLASI